VSPHHDDCNASNSYQIVEETGKQASLGIKKKKEQEKKRRKEGGGAFRNLWR
jgi:hypothetical protein